MPLREYEGPGQIQIDGKTLAESERVSVRVAGNNNRVFTMRRGLAGRSRGPVSCEISVDSAIPKGGLEDTFIEKCVANADVRIVVLLAGKRYTYEGWIEDVDHSQQTSDSARLSFMVVSGPPSVR